ncbi:MAG: hypothetical protein GXO74_10490, partial [Calditrichaeota bacterium]|nr:hypothetical protein [Calditrichota bacterium]
MQFKLFSLIFILNILLAAEAHADAKSNPDIPQFDWHILQFPNSERASYGLFINDSTAWLATGKEKLLHFQHGRWQIDPFFAFELPTSIFGSKKVYVISKNKLSGRWHLQVWEKERWLTIETPNSEMIRGVHFVAPNNIWTACEWGELLHFDGKMWHLITGPSFAHNNAIFYRSDSSIWVASEYYNKRTVSHWTGNHWINYDKAKAGEKEIPFSEIIQILAVNEETCIGLLRGDKDSIVTLKPGEVSLVSWNRLVVDTLNQFIPIYQDSIPFFVKSNAYVKINSGLYSTENEFLLVNKAPGGYSGYWKAANNKIYFIRFLPMKQSNQANSIYEE